MKTTKQKALWTYVCIHGNRAGGGITNSNKVNVAMQKAVMRVPKVKGTHSHTPSRGGSPSSQADGRREAGAEQGAGAGFGMTSYSSSTFVFLQEGRNGIIKAMLAVELTMMVML